MKTLVLLFFISIPISVITAQTALDEFPMKSGEMGGRGKVWEISGRFPDNGVMLEITAAAQPIAANVANDLAPSPDWYLYFIVEVTNERTGVVAFSKRYEFKPRGGLIKAADTLNLSGVPGKYRTTFRFDTEKIASNTRAQVIRINEGTIRTSVATIAGGPAGTAPGQQKRPRFKVD